MTNPEPEEATQPGEEAAPPTEGEMTGEGHYCSEQGEAAHEPGPAPETSAPMVSGSQPAQQVLVQQDDAPLTCAVCRLPIERSAEYLQAAYGPVHATDCSHHTRRL
ncbi:MAG: hypothetical protein ACE5Q6_07645 [Dehalococcoidia bacterium]